MRLYLVVTPWSSDLGFYKGINTLNLMTPAETKNLIPHTTSAYLRIYTKTQLNQNINEFNLKYSNLVPFLKLSALFSFINQITGIAHVLIANHSWLNPNVLVVDLCLFSPVYKSQALGSYSVTGC